VWTHSSADAGRWVGAGKLLAVALLDCTMKVFFADSLKFWLSLYGHKLPVLSMDISSDSTLLASGSADKNLKARRQAACLVKSRLGSTSPCYVQAQRLAVHQAVLQCTTAHDTYPWRSMRA